MLNGCGELTGTIAMAEWGTLEAPIMLTGTTAVGRVFDAVVDAVFEAVPRAGGDDEVVPVPVVGETDDSWLDESRRRHVTLGRRPGGDPRRRSGPVAEGAVGAGTGMVTMGCKAGIGTSSRALPGLGTVGVLVLANFGGLDQLRLGGVAVGTTLAAERRLQPSAAEPRPAAASVSSPRTSPLTPGSSPASPGGSGSASPGSAASAVMARGEIFCAFSTTNRRSGVAEGVAPVDVLGDGSINAVFAATVDATEEAVTNALFVADTVVGRDGHVAPGLPVDRVLELVHHP